MMVSAPSDSDLVRNLSLSAGTKWTDRRSRALGLPLAEKNRYDGREVMFPWRSDDDDDESEDAAPKGGRARQNVWRSIMADPKAQGWSNMVGNL